MSSETANTSPETYDVVVIGGALSGGATATLLLRHNPGIRVLIVEKSAKLTRRVGEATVEVRYFMGRVLGLTQYLNECHLVKQGLRFWFRNNEVKNLSEASELGVLLSFACAFVSARPLHLRRGSAAPRLCRGGHASSPGHGRLHHAQCRRAAAIADPPRAECAKSPRAGSSMPQGLAAVLARKQGCGSPMSNIPRLQPGRAEGREDLEMAAPLRRNIRSGPAPCTATQYGDESTSSATADGAGGFPSKAATRAWESSLTSGSWIFPRMEERSATG